jgi:predicted transcriptional regulator
MSFVREAVAKPSVEELFRIIDVIERRVEKSGNPFCISCRWLANSVNVPTERVRYVIQNIPSATIWKANSKGIVFSLDKNRVMDWVRILKSRPVLTQAISVMT